MSKIIKKETIDEEIERLKKELTEWDRRHKLGLTYMAKYNKLVRGNEESN